MRKRKCCKFFEEQQWVLDSRITTMDRLGADRPRDVVMLAQLSNEQSSWILHLLNEDYCPCQDHPEPELFGEWIDRIIQAKKSGKELSLIDAIDLGESLIEEFENKKGE